jgi:hypothetical protein
LFALEAFGVFFFSRFFSIKPNFPRHKIARRRRRRRNVQRRRKEVERDPREYFAEERERERERERELKESR